jgi:hypothetical protein
LYAGVLDQLANAGISPELTGISQVKDSEGNGIEAGAVAKGYIRRDTMQIQATLTHLFGPTFGADSLALLAEGGIVMIDDLPDLSELRLNAPATARAGSQGNSAMDDLIQVGLSNGAETNPFPSDKAWGYRLLAKLEYNNVFGVVNLSPRFVFSHDVNGTTPDPMFLFVEGRKSASLGLSMVYQNTLTADISLNSFFGGEGTSNNFADRDYFTASLKYSF